MYKKVTSFLDIDYSIVDEFERGDHIDNGVLILRMALHRIVVIGHVD